MRTDIAIDLGTDTTRIFKNKRIALSKPSAVAIDNIRGVGVVYGSDARAMIGRTGDRISAVSPIERGTVADFESAQMLIKQYISDVSGKKMIRPRAFVAIPGGTTAVQQRSVMDALESAGARNVCLVESPLAAAVGLGVDFSTPRGVTIVDIGKGTTDIGVLSMGGLARCESIKLAGEDFDTAIARYVRREHNIDIGILTAEKIKKSIGCVMPRPLDVGLYMNGLSVYSGLPESFEITTQEVYSIMLPIAEDIVKAIRGVFDRTPPEMVADTAEDGLYLIGGSANVYGMSEFLSKNLKVKVITPEEPTECVIKGLGGAMENITILKNGDYRYTSLEDLVIE